MHPELLDASLTTSDKIRRLAKAGYARADIARMLGKRYQHVRNVLEADLQRAPRSISPVSDRQDAAVSQQQVIRLETDADGGLRLPQSVMSRLGVAPGEAVVLDVSSESLVVMTGALALRRAREAVRRFVPSGVSLVDDLIESRRAEEARERG